MAAVPGRGGSAPTAVAANGSESAAAASGGAGSGLSRGAPSVTATPTAVAVDQAAAGAAPPNAMLQPPQLQQRSIPSRLGAPNAIGNDLQESEAVDSQQQPSIQSAELSLCRSILRKHGLSKSLTTMESEVHCRLIARQLIECDVIMESDARQALEFQLLADESPLPDYHVYRRLYTSTLHWTRNALEEHKKELYEVLFVIFFEMWQRLIRKAPDKAVLFLREFGRDHEATKAPILDKIRAVTVPRQLKDCGLPKYAQRNEPVFLRMRRLAYKLLLTHLVATRSTVLMEIVQSRLSIEVVSVSDSNEKELHTIGVAVPAEQHQSSLAVNALPILWGLPEEDVTVDELKEIGLIAPSEKYLKTPAGFAKRYDGEATDVIEQQRLPSTIPEPHTWVSDIWRERKFRHYLGQAEVTPDNLPSILSYRWYTQSEVTCIALGKVDGNLAACAIDDSSIRVLNLSASEMARASADMKGKRRSDRSKESRGGWCDEGGMAMVGANGDDDEGASAGMMFRSSELHAGDEDELMDESGISLSVDDNVSTNPTQSVLRGHDGATYSLSFSANNRLLLSGGVDKTIRLWSVAEQSCLAAYETHQAVVWDIDFAPYDHFFVSASGDCTARLWAVDRSYPIRIFFTDFLSEIKCVRFHPNGAYIAGGSADGSVRLGDVRTGKTCRMFLGHAAGVTGMAISPNGRLVASADSEGTVLVWDLAAGRRVDTLRGHRSRVRGMAFSHGSQILATGSADMTVKLWDVCSLSRGELAVWKGDRGGARGDSGGGPAGAGMPYGASYAQHGDYHPCGTPGSRAAPGGFGGVNKPYGAGAHPGGLYGTPQQRSQPQASKSGDVNEFWGADRLCQSYPVKDTRVHLVEFTPRNFLLTGGVTRLAV